MTEQEWLTANGPSSMLEFLRGRAKERKLWLFGCACYRHVWHLPPLKSLRPEVEIVEKCLDEAEDRPAGIGRPYHWLDRQFYPDAVDAVGNAASDSCDAAGAHFMRTTGGDEYEAYDAEARHQASILRDVFGNPFRPITLDRSRLTATALSIAQAICAERQFDSLPILADALEEAGVVQPELLSHCRQPGEHVLGCWALDLVLGRE